MVYFLFRRRTAFLLIMPALILILGRPTFRAVLLGLPFIICGEAIRIWASGYLSKMSELTTAGPFALCRNPLYVGSFFINLGYFFMSNSLTIGIIGTILFCLFHGAAVKHEEGMLREKFGEPFIDYCKSVPRFFPRPRSMQGVGKFTFQQLKSNHEYKGLSGASAICALFALRAYYSSFQPIEWLTEIVTAINALQ